MQPPCVVGKKTGRRHFSERHDSCILLQSMLAVLFMSALIRSSCFCRSCRRLNMNIHDGDSCLVQQKEPLQHTLRQIGTACLGVQTLSNFDCRYCPTSTAPSGSAA